MKANELLEQYAAGIRDFTGADLSEEDLEGANLSGAILDKAQSVLSAWVEPPKRVRPRKRLRSRRKKSQDCDSPAHRQHTPDRNRGEKSGGDGSFLAVPVA